jgi:hypothetical protein
MSEIKIGVGLDEIKFGMTREEVKLKLGVPGETELYSYSEEEEDLTEVWHYDELEFSISFDEADHWKLVMIADSNDNHTFKGKYLLGKPFDEVCEILNEIGLGNFEVDKLDDEGQVIKLEDQSINIWFDADIASEFQFGPLWNDDDSPIFPA